MIINLTNEQVTELFGDLIYLGSEPMHEYVNGKKTDNIKGLKLRLASSILGKSVDFSMDSLSNIEIKPFSYVKLKSVVYNPYAQRSGDYASLIDRFICEGISSTNQQQKAM